MNWYVYIIECRDDKLYTGITTNVEQRIKEHNSGKGCRFTKFRGPVKLLYKKKFSDRKEAGRKEREIKGLSRAKKLKLVKALCSSNSVFNSAK